MKPLKKIILEHTPAILKKAIIHEYKIEAFNTDIGHHKISYSQQGEDLALTRFFQDKTGPGFYVDIGAYHPVNLSNTHIFYQKGWRGINIEPNPDLIDIFKVARSGDINLNIAIGEKKEELTYYRFNYPALNSFDKQHAQTWAAKDGFVIKDTKQISTYKLDEVLDKHLPAKQQIDFMSIDAEGWDLKILQSNNWDKYRPTIIVSEELINSADAIAESQLIAYLNSKHYSIWNICCGSILFKNDIPA